jgi:dTDP-4-amino-4,6-dideoxygalactose transaminase
MIKDEIATAYSGVMSWGTLMDRHHLPRFEENLAVFVSTKYAVGLNRGFNARWVSLRAITSRARGLSPSPLG